MEVKLTRTTKELTREYEEGTNNFKVHDTGMIDLDDKVLLTDIQSDITMTEEGNKTIYKDEGIWQHGYNQLDDEQKYKYSYTEIEDNETGETRIIRFDEEADEEQIGKRKVKESTFDTLRDKYDNIICRNESTKYSDDTVSSIKSEMKVKEKDSNIKVKRISSESEHYDTMNYDLSENKNKAILKIINQNIDDKNKAYSELYYETDGGQQVKLDDGTVGIFKQITDPKNNITATIQYEPVAMYLDQFDSNNNRVMYERYNKRDGEFKLTLSEKYYNTFDDQNRLMKTTAEELIDTTKKPDDWYQGVNSSNSNLYEAYKNILL